MEAGLLQNLHVHQTVAKNVLAPVADTQITKPLQKKDTIWGHGLQPKVRHVLQKEPSFADAVVKDAAIQKQSPFHLTVDILMEVGR